ncbi:MAG: nucleotide exchange factor GrpE [Desulfotomaculum sp.]|nr:nucleotide exchange factor GrpE [Desulfotomaculum sp.]
MTNEQKKSTVSPELQQDDTNQNEVINEAGFSDETPSIDELQQLLEQKMLLADDYYSRLARIQADFDNFRRRTSEERGKLLNCANEALVTDILPVLDNFQRALDTKEHGSEEFFAGMKMIYSQLLDILDKAGLEEITVLGTEFDPNKHEAIMQVASDEHSENIIVAELRRGYSLKGKVIRPAMVKVAK